MGTSYNRKAHIKQTKSVHTVARVRQTHHNNQEVETSVCARTFRHLCPHDPHSEPHVCLTQDGCVIGAIARHRYNLTELCVVRKSKVSGCVQEGCASPRNEKEMKRKRPTNAIYQQKKRPETSAR